MKDNIEQDAPDSISGYGTFINLPAGSRRPMDFQDQDGDNIDDRYQPGPGQPRPDQQNPPESPTPSSGYGDFINLPPGSRVTKDFIDKDGDGIDDRYQPGPGQPSANSNSKENTQAQGNPKSEIESQVQSAYEAWQKASGNEKTIAKKEYDQVNKQLLASQKQYEAYKKNSKSNLDKITASQRKAEKDIYNTKSALANARQSGNKQLEINLQSKLNEQMAKWEAAKTQMELTKKRSDDAIEKFANSIQEIQGKASELYNNWSNTKTIAELKRDFDRAKYNLSVFQQSQNTSTPPANSSTGTNFTGSPKPETPRPDAPSNSVNSGLPEPFWDGRSRGPESLRWLEWARQNGATQPSPRPTPAGPARPALETIVTAGRPLAGNQFTAPANTSKPKPSNTQPGKSNNPVNNPSKGEYWEFPNQAAERSYLAGDKKIQPGSGLSVWQRLTNKQYGQLMISAAQGNAAAQRELKEREQKGQKYIMDSESAQSLKSINPVNEIPKISKPQKTESRIFSTDQPDFLNFSRPAEKANPSASGGGGFMDEQGRFRSFSSKSQAVASVSPGDTNMINSLAKSGEGGFMNMGGQMKYMSPGGKIRDAKKNAAGFWQPV
jgi:hypothetical protein